MKNRESTDQIKFIRINLKYTILQKGRHADPLLGGI